MSYEGIEVKVGQVWYNVSLPSKKYKIISIDPTTYGWTGNADIFFEGRHQGTIPFCALNKDFSPCNWSAGWTCDNLNAKEKFFTRVSKKTLRKRMREQLAGNFLVGKS